MLHIPTKIGAVISVGGGMEISAVRLFNAILHLAVFQIIGIPTKGEEKSSDMALGCTLTGM